MSRTPGKTIVITGASDGIGAAAAGRLQRTGEHVVVVGRSPQKTAAVAKRLGAEHFVADFADLGQVRQLAGQLLQRYSRIDVLANNAGGVMGATRTLTVDGHEKTFQVNHLAPFLLTTLLLDRLIDSRASVINTSSMAHRFARLRLDDLDAAHGYRPSRAYSNAKLANVLFTKELHRRYHNAGISTAAFHPGTVASNFSSESGLKAYALVYRTPLRNLLLTDVDRGCEGLVWLASTPPGAGWESGRYYAKNQPARIKKAADDPVLAEHLWERSLDMVAMQR